MNRGPIAKILLFFWCVNLLPSTAKAQLSGDGTNVGYIDSAPLRNQARFRYDAAYGNTIPDWGEFFYPKCGCLPNAPGPPLAETNVDYQEFRLHFEHVLAENLFSVFAELPFRVVNPTVNRNAGGISDINAGVKVSLYDDTQQNLTFQFRTYLPTGDGSRGLGNEHISLEPAVLYLRRLSERTTLETELRDFIPIGGTDNWPANVLRYGVGISHLMYDGDHAQISPVAEAVGWSMLNGRGLDVATGPRDTETTIVNLKLGARIGFGRATRSGTPGRSLYVGYGRSLTGTRWYDDVFRAEVRVLY
ncbi:MAG: hypothetical protein KDA81_11740 [Planctomycetaceae bacterium]|nr:hypothetical protein [Planctomycetaceae bacterium]